MAIGEHCWSLMKVAFVSDSGKVPEVLEVLMPMRRMKVTLQGTKNSPMLIVELLHWPHCKISAWTPKPGLF